MAAMTVEFFKVKILKRSNREELEYKLIEQILGSIFEKYAVKNNGSTSIDLSPKIMPNSVEPKEVMDLFDDDSYLFGRICRKKANNAIIKRDYTTLKAETVFTNMESTKNGIEVFTFFILDYNKGILSIVNTKGAPGTKAFKALCENYCPEYDFEFMSIPNEEGVRVLYLSENPEISRMEFELPSPNAEFLQRVLGLNEGVIRDIIKDNVYSASIIFKPAPYNKLVCKKEKVKEILDILINKKKQFSKTLIKGKSEKFGSRNFDLNARLFTYPIDIRQYRIVQGQRIEYSLQEIVEQFKYGLHMAYETNYDMINAIADR